MTLVEINMKEAVPKEVNIIENGPKNRGRKRKLEGKESESISSKKSKAIVMHRPDISGMVLTAGTGDIGQLGLGPDIEERTKPAAVKDLPQISSICAGGLHSVCLTCDGKVYTWGCNDEGALGRKTEDEEDNFNPGLVNIDGDVVQISAGDCHSVALTADGRAFAWGAFRDNSGLLGFTEKSIIQHDPVQILKGVVVKKVASGHNHIVFLSDKGVVYTWGCGECGQLGRIAEYFANRDSRHRNVTDVLLSPLPIKVYKGRKRVTFSDIWAGGLVSFVKASETGDIYGFGLNNYWQLGDRDQNMKFQPFLLKEFKNKDWKLISPGQHHSIALTEDGNVYVMGRHEYGRLGLYEKPEDPKNATDAEIPTLVPSFKNKKAVHVAAGECVSFVVLDNGEAYAFGMGTNNQLCSGEEEDSWEPSIMLGKQLTDKKIVAVEAGGQHTILLGIQENNNSTV